MEEWTDEKHVEFLKSLEARFVRTMLEVTADNRSRPRSNSRYRSQDCFNSTADSGRRMTIKREAPDSGLDTRGTRTGSRIMYSRPQSTRSRRPSQRHELSQDQVVPKMENEKEDKDGTFQLNQPALSDNSHF